MILEYYYLIFINFVENRSNGIIMNVSHVILKVIIILWLSYLLVNFEGILFEFSFDPLKNLLFL